MFDNKMADTTFGINNQALAVLHYIANSAPDFAPYEKENGWYDFSSKTVPWYNCRESGFCLSIAKARDASKVLHIAVFEHRNSDNICALKWETDHFYMNHPLQDPNIWDVAYGGAEKTKYDVAYSVGCGEIGKMASWIYQQCEDFFRMMLAQTDTNSN